MKRKQIIQFAIGGTLAFLLFSTLTPLSQSKAVSQVSPPVPVAATVLPEVAAACLEPAGKSFEVVATQSENNKTFYYLQIWAYGVGDDFESWYSLIQVDSSGCRRLKGVKSGLKPISSFMKMSTAQQLELQRYQHDIARVGGKEAFERRLNQKLSPPANSAYSGVKIYLSEEQVWALHQLGIHFPNNYQLLRPSQSIHPERNR